MMVPPTLSTMASRSVMRNASMLNDLLLSRSWNTDSDTHPFLLGTRCSHLKSRHTQRCALKQMDLWIITRNFSLDRTRPLHHSTSETCSPFLSRPDQREKGSS